MIKRSTSASDLASGFQRRSLSFATLVESWQQRRLRLAADEINIGDDFARGQDFSFDVLRSAQLDDGYRPFIGGRNEPGIVRRFAVGKVVLQWIKVVADQATNLDQAAARGQIGLHRFECDPFAAG